eukprot:8686286-Karenia_brevis.AAC.1
MEARAPVHGQLDRYVTKASKNACCCLFCPSWSWEMYQHLNSTHRRMDGCGTPVRKNYGRSRNL